MTITRQELIERLKAVNTTTTEATALTTKGILSGAPLPLVFLNIIPESMRMVKATQELFEALTGDELSEDELTYILSR